jgi:hypothetical protein
MTIDLNDSSLWGEFGIKYEGTFEKLLDEFYKKYQKTLRSVWGFSKDREDSIRLLKEHLRRNRNFLIEVYLTHLEKSLTHHDTFKLKEGELDIGNLKRYSRLLVTRLNKSVKIENGEYYRPNVYPNPFHSKEATKIWFVLKKKVGNAIKSSKRKRVYSSYPERFIVITKKGDDWILRCSFKNQKEKGIIKKVFQSKRVVVCKESKINEIFEKIIEDTDIFGVSGEFNKGDKSVDYSFSSEKSLNEVIKDEFDHLFSNEIVLEKINGFSFSIDDKKISFKIVPHRFNVKHLKMITTGLTPAEIWERSSSLSEKYGLSEDIYIISPEHKKSRLFHILNNDSLDEVDIMLLKEELDYLEEKRLIHVDYYKRFKRCMNKECHYYEDNFLFEYSIENCDNCDQKLIKFGTRANIRKNFAGIRDFIKETLTQDEFEYKGEIKKIFKKTSETFYKYVDGNKNEFLLYIYEGNKNAMKLLKSFSERSLPVLAITMKDIIAKNLIFDIFCIGKLSISDLFLQQYSENLGRLKANLKTINLKQERWKIQNMERSLTILKEYLQSNFDKNKLEGSTPQKKGNHFEKLINDVVKPLSNSWVELGQSLQNKSVPDGAGQIKTSSREYLFGLDAKLKISEKSRGLSSKERDNQKKYIEEFKIKSYGYGGLKNWLIIIKSEKDYSKFENSIRKLKEESGFGNILLLGVEPLLKICEAYDESLEEGIINKEIFHEILDKLLIHKGHITSEKVEKIFEKEKVKYEKLKII